MENETIVLERLLNAPIAKVWKAITNKDEMKKWYFDLEEFEAKKGFKFQFSGGPDEGPTFLHLCEITEVIEKEKLTYSWRYDGYEGISFVTFELSDRDNQTLLKLTHKGIGSFPKNNPAFAIHNFKEGWNQIINQSLTAYLAKS